MGTSPYRGRLGASFACGADVTRGGISRPAAWHAAWHSQAGGLRAPVLAVGEVGYAHVGQPHLPRRPQLDAEPARSAGEAPIFQFTSNDPSASFTIRSVIVK